MSTFDAAADARASGTDRDDGTRETPGPDEGREGRGAGEGWFVRAAGAVADLASPFYREERQRDVWNEASAVGYQLVLWLGMAAAAAMVWTGGATALPYAVTLYAVIGASAWVSIAYSRSLGVSGTEGVRVLRARTLVCVLLLAVFVVGAVRAVPAGQSGFVGGVSTGVGIGAGIAAAVGLGLLAASRRSRRRRG